MTDLEDQQNAMETLQRISQTELARLHSAIRKACADFNNIHREVCEGNSNLSAVESIFEELEREVDRWL
jgi:hypothetical protein